MLAFGEFWTFEIDFASNLWYNNNVPIVAFLGRWEKHEKGTDPTNY